MLKDVTFGQYYPGNSLLHKTDPRFKMLILIEYLIIVLVSTAEIAVAVSILYIDDDNALARLSCGIFAAEWMESNISQRSSISCLISLAIWYVFT